MPQALVGAGGFLAGILWMHLMFDFQALGESGTLPAPALAIVAAHYRHVTEGADPMGNVVYLVMILAVLGAVLQISRPAIPLWMRSAALVAAVVPLLYTLIVVDPAAVRLGGGESAPAGASELARTVLWGHLACLVFVLAFIGVQIAATRHASRSPGAP